MRAGVDRVEIRDRELGGAALVAFAREVARAARRGADDAGRAVSIVVNRRIDVALACGADGVHLGWDALGPADAAALLARLGASGEIGVSAHAAAEVAAAARAGATYAHLAPIWAPQSKRAERPPLGPAALVDAAAAGIPVLAQGGVTAERCGDALAAGAAGVAVTGAILLAADPADAAAALRSALDRSPAAAR